VQDAAVRSVECFDDDVAEDEEGAEQHEQAAKQATAICAGRIHRHQLAEEEHREGRVEESAIRQDQVDGLAGRGEQGE